MSSLTFDRAVSFYDKTRAIPEWVSNAITNSIIELAQVNAQSKILEIGIGTGRIALPLTRRNLPIIGIDLSLSMMRELQKKIGEQAAHAMLAQADANHLPFIDSAFDCIYAVHVYHLVADWQYAIAQAWRVVKPGGCFLVTFHHRDPQSVNSKLRRRLFDLVKARGVDTRRPGSQSYDELRSEIEKHSPTKLAKVAQWHERKVTVEQIIDEIEKRQFSETWVIPEAMMPQVIPMLREWAQAEFGSLDYSVDEEEEFNWLVARK